MKSYELTNYSPLNTVIINVDIGKEIRCISSTPSHLRGTTKLSRYIDAESSTRDAMQVESDEQSAQEDASESDPRLEEIARVNWNFFTGTWMVYGGKIVTVAKLMPPTNWTKA